MAPKTPSKTSNMKGMFADGIWKCNCDPRMPADHFQTKNGGPNHGRWFYTCQKAQPKRCNFFLWDNEAKAREARAVLANSHTEPFPATEPFTPSRAMASKDSAQAKSPPMTPHSDSKFDRSAGSIATPQTGNNQQSKRDDKWLYVSDDDLDSDQLRGLTDQTRMPPPEKPSKGAKDNIISSPGKRNHEDFQERRRGRPEYGKPTSDIDLFNTPNNRPGLGLFSGAQTAPHPRGTHSVGGLFSPNETPAMTRFDAPGNLDVSSEKIPVIGSESPSARKSNNIQYPPLQVTAESPAKPESKTLLMTPLAKQILDVLLGEHVGVTDRILDSVKAVSLKYLDELEDVKKGSQKHMKDLSSALKSRDWARDKIKRQEARIKQLEAEVEKLRGPSGKG